MNATSAFVLFATPVFFRMNFSQNAFISALFEGTIAAETIPHSSKFL
jgi:hypothetical protein